MPDRTRFARHVGKYLEYRPAHLEAAGGAPEEPMAQKHRGISRPPVNTRGFRWIDEAVSFAKSENEEKVACTSFENRKHHALLNAIVESYRLGIETHRGVAFSSVVAFLWEDPAFVTWAMNGESETAKDYHAAFKALCARIAGDFLQIEPLVELTVEVPASDARVAGIRAARKQDTRESYRRIVAQIEALESEGSTREDAKAHVREELNCGRTRIRDALSFVKAWREDPEKADAEWVAKERKQYGRAG